MKNFKKGLTLVAILSIALLGSCGGSGPSTSGGGGNSNTSEGQHDTTFYVTYKGVDYEEGADLEVVMGDKVAVLVAKDILGGTPEFTYQSSDESVLIVGEHTGLLTPVSSGKSADVSVYPTGNQDAKMVFHISVVDAEVAKGAHSYASASYEEKANLLGALEKYAVDNYLTGITMFSNGSNIAYNDRYVPTPKSYISGYGWGTMREGVLKNPIQSPLPNHDPNMYQVATTSLPAHLNAMNASGSDVSDAANYITTSYYTTRMNETNDGYEWYPLLANDARPLPIDDTGAVITENQSEVLNTRWRIHVKTGDNFVYRTASTKSKNGVQIKSFDGRAVTLEDYITPIKFMLTGYNGQYRGPEQTKGISGLALNAAKYLANTPTKPSQYKYYDEEKWEEYNMDEVVKTGHDEGGDYIEFNLQQPCTQFYAMYYLSSSLYSPLPADFIELWDPTDLGKSPDGYTPLDTMLSTGPYYISRWESKDITFKKNDRYFYTEDKFASGNTRKVYNLPGFEYREVEDPSTAKNLFESGSVDSYVPNKDDLKESYKASSGTTSKGVAWRKYETKGDSNFKVNVNATSTEQWTNFFGKNGSVYQHDFDGTDTTKSYLKTRGYMSDIHFLNFLSFGMDRKTICESRGMKPTQEYFSDNYLIDPEKGISYNSTDAHKAVLADRYNETYGYNESAAESELRKAIDGSITDMISKNQIPQVNGKYIITVTMEWMNPTDTKDYSDVFDSIKKIFKKVSDKYYYGNYVLDLKEPTPSSDYNAVYDKMKRGEFDLGFGAISGGELNPINFAEVLKSDNSSGFTLNWGPDTSKVDAKDPIVYDGQQWSFDALWNAANTGVLLNEQGDIANAINVSKNGSGANKYEERNEANQSITYKLSFQELINAGAKANSISVQVTNGSVNIEHSLAELGATVENGYVGTITLDKSFNELVDESSGKPVTVVSKLATFTFVYEVEFEGEVKTFNSTLRLPTFAGSTK